MQRINYVANDLVLGQDLIDLRDFVYRMCYKCDDSFYEEMLHQNECYDETGKRITNWRPKSSAFYDTILIPALHNYSLPIEYLKYNQHDMTEKAIIFIHGAAFMRRVQDHNCKILEAMHRLLGNVDVYLPDYRVGLNASIDETLNDICDAYEYVLHLGYAPDNVILIGDSSGATHTLSSLQLLAKRKSKAPGFVVLQSGLTNMQLHSQSFRQNKETDPVLGDGNTMIYRGIECQVKNLDKKNPYISPIFGNYDYFSCNNGCRTKILIQAGLAERIVDDSVQLFHLLEQAGCDCYLELYQDMYHDFEMYRHMNKMTDVCWDHFATFVGLNFDKEASLTF